MISGLPMGLRGAAVAGARAKPIPINARAPNVTIFITLLLLA
jgi:hypothetical protein